MATAFTKSYKFVCGWGLLKTQNKYVKPKQKNVTLGESGEGEEETVATNATVLYEQ